MTPPYQRKIQPLAAVAAAVGPRPRTRRVGMCHGVFDLVHPGHLRHLAYLKERVDILVVSVTCDREVTKGPYRPYVPEALRALNLAALEVVDYVMIDRQTTPIAAIEALQPDVFAKGYEYHAEGLSPETHAEAVAVQSYGGEMLFTPGDVAYSSTAILQAIPPTLAVEKLLALLDSEGITFQDLRDAMRPGVRATVVGDTIVDAYTAGVLLGASQKTPALSVQRQETALFAGGAAVVARHLRAAGAEVTLLTVLGKDWPGDWIVQQLAPEITLRDALDPRRPTTYKERFQVDGRILLQVDRVDNAPIGEATLAGLERDLASSDPALVIFSDFRHGLFGPHSTDRLTRAIPPRALKVADSQVATRWGNVLDFRGFDLLTPNEREARFALGDQDSGLRPLALALFQRAGCRGLLLKLAHRGLLGYQRPDVQVRDFFAVESFVDRLVDPVGAGDALLAYASLALLTTGRLVIAAVLGSLAAAVACERAGNVPVTDAEVREKLDALEKRATFGGSA